MKPFDIDALRKKFRLNDGCLERFVYRKNGNSFWKEVKSIPNSTKEYCQVYYNGKNVYYHNIIWVLHTGKNIPDGLFIDHINGNKSDNVISNLRIVSNRENSQNRDVHRKGKLAGVGFYKKYNNFVAHIQIGGNFIYLGYYDTEIEAHNAYKIACNHTKDYTDNKSFREIIKSKLSINEDA